MAVRVDVEKCTGCGRCLAACPYGAVILVGLKAVLTERCTLCGACAEACPEKAILADLARTAPDFSDHRGVWVVAEVDPFSGRLKPVSLELLGCARGLAGETGRVTAVLLGHRVGHLAQDLIRHGADQVRVVEGEGLSRYLTLPYTSALAEAVRAGKPEILLLPATPQGRDLAPRLARRLGLGLTADCTELSLEPDTGLLLQTRPAFGGEVMATIVSRYSRPQTATIRPGVMRPIPPDPDRRGEVFVTPAPAADSGVEVLQAVREAGRAVDLSQAKVIVAGGRGVGSREGFALLEKLASALGGQVGGTRAAVEEGFIAPERQIGQTGVTVRPELYLAVGISGAIQHRAGILGSRYILAVNKDPRAAIFEVADFGLVGDFRQIVPALIEAVKKGGAA